MDVNIRRDTGAVWRRVPIVCGSLSNTRETFRGTLHAGQTGVVALNAVRTHAIVEVSRQTRTVLRDSVGAGALDAIVWETIAGKTFVGTLQNAHQLNAWTYIKTIIVGAEELFVLALVYRTFVAKAGQSDVRERRRLLILQLKLEMRHIRVSSSAAHHNRLVVSELVSTQREVLASSVPEIGLDRTRKGDFLVVGRVPQRTLESHTLVFLAV